MSLYEPDPEPKRLIFLLFLAFFVSGFIYEAFNEHSSIRKNRILPPLIVAVIIIFVLPAAGPMLPYTLAAVPAGYVSGIVCCRIFLKKR